MLFDALQRFTTAATSFLTGFLTGFTRLLFSIFIYFYLFFVGVPYMLFRSGRYLSLKRKMEKSLKAAGNLMQKLEEYRTQIVATEELERISEKALMSKIVEFVDRTEVSEAYRANSQTSKFLLPLSSLIGAADMMKELQESKRMILANQKLVSPIMRCIQRQRDHFNDFVSERKQKFPRVRIRMNKGKSEEIEALRADMQRDLDALKDLVEPIRVYLKEGIGRRRKKVASADLMPSAVKKVRFRMMWRRERRKGRLRMSRSALFSIVTHGELRERRNDVNLEGGAEGFVWAARSGIRLSGSLVSSKQSIVMPRSLITRSSGSQITILQTAKGRFVASMRGAPLLGAVKVRSCASVASGKGVSVVGARMKMTSCVLGLLLVLFTSEERYQKI